MRHRLLLFLLLIHGLLPAQPVLRLVLPASPVHAGESFSVQYVLEGGAKNVVFKTPVFRGFRLISGPNVYQGGAGVQNAVFTLEAVKQGSFSIPAGEAIAGTQTVRSAPGSLTIIANEEDMPGTGEIRKGLFIRVTVNKTSCFVGEPVLVSYTLYSNLESSSDIIRNPGFYGFAVSDMVGLSEQQLQTVVINGKTFDAHLIRQVQLFPQQAGLLTVDEMEISNTVYITGSAKPGRMEIHEGTVPARAAPAGTKKEYHFTIQSEPQYIRVKALPQPAPPEFSGAVGSFQLHTALRNNALYKNEEGLLQIRIHGSGNLNQLVAPAIKWPDSMEVFEARTRDSLQKKQYPLTGDRIFEIPFIPPAPGAGQTPGIRFVYFDPEAASYKSIESAALRYTVKDEIRKTETPHVVNSASFGNNTPAKIGALIVVLGVMGFLVYWLFVRREKHPETPVVVKIKMQGPEHFLPPVQLENSNGFYRDLQNGMLAFLKQYTAGKTVSRVDLLAALGKLGMKPEQEAALTQIMDELDLHQFSGVSEPEKYIVIREQAIALLQELAGVLPAEISADV